MKRVIKAIKLIFEGRNLNDKITILKYFLNVLNSKISNVKINPHLKKEVTIQNKDGVFYCGNHINSVWVASTIHEENIRKYFDLDEGVFIDVGANIGKYTIKIAKKLKSKGKVISIEPEPSNFKILKKNVLLNNLKNVHLFNLACSSKVGVISFYLNKSGTGSHSILKKTDHKILVKSSPLDKIILLLKIKKIDFLKIDAEGAELSVLQGAKKILKSKPRIILEVEDPKKFKEINIYLKKFGYDFKRISLEEYLFF